VLGEHRHHLVAFVQRSRPVSTKTQVRLIADRAVQQRGDHGGIDAAGQAQDHLVVAHLLAHAGDRRRR
jgi:hypothetical protein